MIDYNDVHVAPVHWGPHTQCPILLKLLIAVNQQPVGILLL